MSHQEALTIIAKVDPRRVASLEAQLDTIRANPAQNDVVPFGALNSCHFGRFLFLPQSPDLNGQRFDPQLMLLSDCDGSAQDHLEALVDVAGDGIDRVFGHCADYPRNPASRAERLRYLRKHSVNTKANYVHRQGRTVEQIRGEAQLRQAIEQFVGNARALERRVGNDNAAEALSACDMRSRIQGFLKNEPSLRWALDAPADIDLLYRAQNALHFLTLPLAFAVFGPMLVPAILLLIALVRLQERSDLTDHVRPSAEHVQQLAALEDFVAHNGFTAGGCVKPGLVRRAVVASVLPLIGYGTRHLFTRDSLAGVKTIHFARWIPIDKGRRVVFASNYDGSLESYNNDFIDLVSWGLNLVFSNGYGYPETRWLVLGGATREQEFKDYLRVHQIPTPIWYSAYPQLTAINIERNASLRAGLHGRMNEREAQQWLRLL